MEGTLVYKPGALGSLALLLICSSPALYVISFLLVSVTLDQLQSENIKWTIPEINNS